VPRIAVQHHHAHLAACLAENGVEGEVLGVAWDGTGLGTDGTIWGGEFLLGSAVGFRRVAHLRAFRLMGGDAAAREPRRSALAALLETFGEACLAWQDLAPIKAFEPSERMLLATMRARAFNAPATTSAGRLFDAVAALLGLGQRVSFEGQAAMALEFAADPSSSAAYPMPILEEGGAAAALVLDWVPALAAIVEDLRRGTPAGAISARFHNALADAIAAVARRVGCARVALTGGCFQNRRLVETAAARLEMAGFEVLLHRQVPPNDGGLALGQVAVAAAIEAGRGAWVPDTDAAPATDGLLVAAGSAPGTGTGRGGD
jgi:hydrogenase maturation protein HypF